MLKQLIWSVGLRLCFIPHTHTLIQVPRVPLLLPVLPRDAILPLLVRLCWLESRTVFENSFQQPNFIHGIGGNVACGFFPLFLFRLFCTSSRSSSSTVFGFLSPIPTPSGPLP